MNNIAVISPNDQTVSETFIKAHVEGIDGNVFHFHGGYFPKRVGNESIYEPLRSFIQRQITRIGFFFFRRKNRLDKPTMEDYLLVLKFKSLEIELAYAEYGLTGIEVMKACKLSGVKLIVNLHGFDIHRHIIIQDNRDKYIEMFDLCSRIIVVSKTMREEVLKYGSFGNKLIYTPCAPNDRFFELTPSFESSNFLFIGRFVNKKAPYYPILIWPEVIKHFPNAQLHMVGDGPLRETCTNVAKQLGLENNVIFHGAVPFESFKSLMENSCALLQPSVKAEDGDMEGTPVAIMEANAAGIPVIGSRHAGIQDIIQHEVNGLLFNEHDTEQLKNALVEVLINKNKAQKMGQKGREIVKQSYTMNSHLVTINSAIKEVLGSH